MSEIPQPRPAPAAGPRTGRPHAASGMSSSPRASLRRLRRIAWLLDESIRLPLLGWRIGLDSLLGLLPGIGDLLGTAVSSYILVEALRLRTPPALFLRMLATIAIDTLIGLLPLAGDVADAAWKANLRNVALLERHLHEPAAAARGSRWWLGIGLGLLALLLLLLGGAVILLAHWLWRSWM